MKTIADGVWPTMLTPFTDDNKIDYSAMERLIEWYIEKGVNGIFSMCQSSEMFYLNTREKLDVVKFVVKTVGGRVPVIASGHTAESIGEQISELSAIADTGIDALVLLTNILAGREKSEYEFKKNVQTITETIRGIPFGLYECPYPYKFLLPTELLKWGASSGKFLFLKDTCCDINIIEQRLKTIKNTDIKLFNANAATLLASLRLGASGFSGVMANFFPELFVWLADNFESEPDMAEKLQSFLGAASMVEYLNYPVCAKYHLGRILGMGLNSRSAKAEELSSAAALQVEQLGEVMRLWTNMIFNRS